MQKSTFFLLIFVLYHISLAFGQSKPTKLFLGIPETDEKTNAIIRYSNTTYNLKSINNLTINYDYAITIIDNGGKDYATIVIPYDNHSRVSNISAYVYDQLGQKIESARTNDFKDIPYTASHLYDDLRLLYYEGLQRRLPITIYVQYKKIYTDFFHMPQWRPQIGKDVFVNEASLKIINDKNIPYRYFYSSFPDSIISFSENSNIKTWEIKNLNTFTKEKFGPDLKDQLPSITFPMDQFQMEGYRGSFKSWKDMADFDLKLKEGLLALEPSTVSKLHAMTDSINDPKEKARVLYKWMQKETRYESIQLGLGGWKPFSAKYVDEKKYGDCKALTNYMQALLDAVGIKSHYSSIQAGSINNPINPEEVYNQFNHIILCIPFDADTTWLECTSDNSSFGYLGDFTDDRYALVVKENGSLLAKTPKYTFKDNLLSRKSIIEVNEEGGYQGYLKAEYHNIQSEKRWFQKDENLREQMDNLYKITDINGFTIHNLDYNFIDDKNPIVFEKIDFYARQIARTTSSKMLLPLFYLNSKPRKLKSDDDRRFEIVLKRGSTTIDTVTYQIPSNYKVNTLPDSIKLKSEFGSYESNTWLEGNQIYYYRKEIINDGRFPPEYWEDFRNYKNAVRKVDKATAVLEKVTQ